MVARRLALFGVLAVLVGLLPAVPVAGAAEPERVAGPSRFATSVAIAQRSFPDGANVVYLARGDAFADALAAGTLTDGPVLLVPSCGEPPPETAPEIARLDPDTVIALGGANAVCDDLLSTLADGRATDRLAADDRFGTAAAIATRAFPAGADVVYVADAADSPDAVAGGALTDGPILLVPSDGQPPETVTATVERIDPGTVIALGGTNAVAEATLAAAAAGRATDRVAGPSRFDTAAAIAERAFPTTGDVTTAYLARGDVFADAVASGSLTDGPVLLVGSCGPLPTAVVDYLTAATVDTVTALGGTQAVCDQVLTDAAALPTNGTSPPPEPTPTPEPTPPAGAASGTLYTTEFSVPSGLIAIDVADTDAPREIVYPGAPPSLVGPQYDVLPDIGEFVYTEEGAGDTPNPFTVVIRDLDDRTVKGQFERYCEREDGSRFRPGNAGPVTPSPDGRFFIGFASCTSPSDSGVVDILDRSGEKVFVFEGVALHDWAWTPEGDLVIARELAEEDRTDPDVGAFVGVIDIDDLVAAGEDESSVDGRVIREFAGGDETPGYLSVSNGGDQVAYRLNGERRGELYVMPFTGDAEPHLVAQHTTALLWTAFSPDDSQLAVGVFAGGTGTRIPNTRSVVIPNHRDAAPIPLFDDEESYALETPLPGETPGEPGGDPDTVSPVGPFVWAEAAPTAGRASGGAGTDTARQPDEGAGAGATFPHAP